MAILNCYRPVQHCQAQVAGMKTHAICRAEACLLPLLLSEGLAAAAASSTPAVEASRSSSSSSPSSSSSSAIAVGGARPGPLLSSCYKHTQDSPSPLAIRSCPGRLLITRGTHRHEETTERGQRLIPRQYCFACRCAFLGIMALHGIVHPLEYTGREGHRRVE